MATSDPNYTGASGDWEGATWDQAGFPGPGDSARISGSATALVTNLDQDLNTWGINARMAKLLVAETYTGDLGVLGGELKINCDLLIYRSGGAQGFIIGGFDTVHAYPVKGLANALIIKSRDATGSGKIGRLYAGRGWTTIVAGSTVDEAHLVPGANDARLIIQAGTTIPGDLHVDSGLCLMNGEVDGIIHVTGGICRMPIDTADASRIKCTGGKFEYDAGLISGGSFVLAVKAFETLTLSANVSNGDTVTIDTKVYTFQTTLTDVNGNVKIGAAATDSIDNLIAAINLTSGAGSTYAASMTIHPTAFAAVAAGDTMLTTANSAGTAGNTIATTEVSTNASWGAATMSGGVNRDDTPSLLVIGGHFDAHKHGKFGTIANVHAIGETSMLDFRTGTQAIARTNALEIGNPRILLDPADTF